MISSVEPQGVPPTRWALFSVFFKIGVLGFGGVAAFARHVLVVERQFLTEQDFADSFGFASTLPGANTVNLAAILGDRWRGPTGAIIGVIGLTGAPVVILLAIMVLYARFSGLPDVRAGLAGAAAAAAGLVVGTSIKLLQSIDPDVLKILIFVGVCVASGFGQFPMALILAVALPLSIGLTFLLAPRA